ncbi:ATP-binding cassette domain-containing protein [Desulfobacula sp.]|uniref:ABC transporter ATP-binding protein n=1 Tax=Desulfobacula sp. TaxID=2593537 RepID=UPI0026266BAA|nr:ATP-binding cassette domain-containing protein [Desulfobacula sp.]
MNSKITCRNLSVAFSGENSRTRSVLDNINVTFPAGKMNIITGPIGAGKSTLLHTMAGLTRPTSGEVVVNDQAVSRWSGAHRDQWRRQAGIIFQHCHLLHELTVLENIMLPLIPLGHTVSHCRSQSIAALKQVALFHHAGRLANSLSGGERQKTAIARALVTQPHFIFADEPTAHMDAENSRQMMELLYHCTGRNAVVIVATHESILNRLPGPALCYRLENGALNHLTD